MNEHAAQGQISVAMCTYNGEPYLQEQLDSISAQTRLPCELVVCDDRSKDGTVEILNAFAKTAPFPVRVSVNDEQLGSTRNFDKAMRLCRGEYISLTDQDDRWMPEKLARLGGLLDANPEVGGVFSDASLMNASQPVPGSLWKSFRFQGKAQATFLTHPDRIMLRHNVVTGATMMFRRSILAHFEAIPASWVHDAWLTWMCILWSKMLFTPEPLTVYRLHAAQQLGVGQTAFFARLRSIRSGERERYRRDARQFRALLDYLHSPSVSRRPEWQKDLVKKIDFLYARADAPPSLVGRLIFLRQHAHSYFDIAGGGLRSMCKDLVISRSETK